MSSWNWVGIFKYSLKCCLVQNPSGTGFNRLSQVMSCEIEWDCIGWLYVVVCRCITLFDSSFTVRKIAWHLYGLFALYSKVLVSESSKYYVSNSRNIVTVIMVLIFVWVTSSVCFMENMEGANLRTFPLDACLLTLVKIRFK